jgi:hypothetical protein
VRPDRQTQLFSATLPRRIESLVSSTHDCLAAAAAAAAAYSCACASVLHISCMLAMLWSSEVRLNHNPCCVESCDPWFSCPLQVGEALSNPVRISVGQLGAANQDVTQRVEVLPGAAGRCSAHVWVYVAGSIAASCTVCRADQDMTVELASCRQCNCSQPQHSFSKSAHSAMHLVCCLLL